MEISERELRRMVTDVDDHPALRQTAMTVGGVEARHMAVLAKFITPAPATPAGAFQPTEKAADPSFFV